jgi:diguanylate cyclase (GGDEF)-like protein
MPVLLVGGLLLLSIPLCVPWVVPKDARFLMYPYGAALDLIPLCLCWLAARQHAGLGRAQWLLLAGHFAMRSLSLWIPTAEIWFGLARRESSWLLSGASCAATMFCLLALTMAQSEARLAKRYLDGAMALILCVLNFLALFSSAPIGFSNFHLQMSFATALFLLICAWSAQAATESGVGEQFTRVVIAYLIARCVMVFSINIVDYLWLATPRELPFDLLYGLPPIAFSIALLHSGWQIPLRLHVPRRVLASTALPASVLLASVLLAIGLSPEYRWLSATAILLSVVCFILRTQLLYERLLEAQIKLQTQAATLDQLANLDPLTGIGNRRFFELRASAVLDQENCIASLLLIDTDHFKQVNDSLGHATGDRLLERIASILAREAVLSAGYCARIGGDEFAILLIECHPREALELAERVRVQVSCIQLESVIRPSVSIGVAATTGRARLGTLLELADEALYESKAKGRNRVEMAQMDAVDFQTRGRHIQRRRFRERPM